MSFELASLIIQLTLGSSAIFSIIFAIIQLRRGGDQRFREILSNYLLILRQMLQLRFDEQEKDVTYRTSLLTLDQCSFSILNRQNKIRMNLTDELSKLSTTLYFGDLNEIKEKLQAFRSEIFK